MSNRVWLNIERSSNHDVAGSFLMWKDIEAAKYNKVKSIALSTGFYSYDILKKHKPDYLLANLSDLKIIERIFK